MLTNILYAAYIFKDFTYCSLDPFETDRFSGFSKKVIFRRLHHGSTGFCSPWMQFTNEITNDFFTNLHSEI